MALVAEVALARIERKEGKGQSTEAIIRRFAESGGADRPILLSAEPIKLPDNPRMNADKSVGGIVLALTAGNFEDRWLDVGFWVNSNGLVSDVEILRSEAGVRVDQEPHLRAAQKNRQRRQPCLLHGGALHLYRTLYG